jgi:uncharacterized protein with ATP-grasp and redox domains
MKILIECLPCMLKQTFEATQMVTDDPEIQNAIMDEAIEILKSYRDFSCAPAMSEVMHDVIKKHSGNLDPYAAIKAQDISRSLALESKLQHFIKSDSARDYLKVAAVGNILDSALFLNVNIEEILDKELRKPFVIDAVQEFEDALKTASNVLVVADNAGEVVFDKPIVRWLSKTHKVTYVLRGRPALNDATLDDALTTGIDAYAKLITTGSGMPGAVYEACSKEFREAFDSADLVLSKGQGNLESLSEAKRPIFFLLKAKCNRIASALGVPMGSNVFKSHQGIK